MKRRRSGGLARATLTVGLMALAMSCGSDQSATQRASSALTVGDGGTDVGVGADVSADAAPAASAAAVPTLDTFVNRSIQIDRLGAQSPADANLFTGRDPADGTASLDFPAGGPTPFIDWNDLGGDLANHRTLDLDDPVTGRDVTAFPRSNECVGPANVLRKMDLTYVAASSNLHHVYLGVQRASNLGDAAYYWVFTRREPRLVRAGGPCQADEQRLVYDITGPASDGGAGDVLIIGQFHPNTEALIRVYNAVASRPDVGGVDAINYLDTTLWRPSTEPAAAAVNTTPTAPGAFGSAGVTAMDGDDLGTEIFAEAAVPLSVFTSRAPCAGNFYGTVITRASGSGSTQPDLKDFSGPVLYDFGHTVAQARLTPTCGLALGYQASATRPDQTPVPRPSCRWEFTNGTTTRTSEACSGELGGIPPGTYTGTVTVTDADTGCVTATASSTVTVHPPLTVAANLAPACSSVTYAATANGGSNPSGVTYAWSFSGGSPDPASSTSRTGTVATGTLGVAYTGTVVVTDPRTDIACTATASASASPHKTNAAARLTPACGLSFGFGATATDVTGAAVPGATCAWRFDNGASSNDATSCAGSATAPAGAHTATVTVTDPATGCTDTVTTAAVDVFPPLAATVTVAPTCTSFTHDVAVTGGSDAARVTYAWTFTGGPASPATSTSRGGSVTVGATGVPYTATVVVTDARRDVACTVTASGSTLPHHTTGAARLTPTCGLSFGYEGSATSSSGAALSGAACAWRFDNGATSTDCAGNTAAAAGAHTGTLTITDPATGCSDTVTAARVNVFPPLTVAADLGPACSSVTYAATATGGSNPSGVTYAWSFGGGGSVDPASSTSRTGTVATGTLGVAYTGTVVATDSRTDITCTATASDSASPHKTTAAARLTPTCGLSFGFAATATDVTGAAVPGATCAWRFDNGASSNAATSCAGSATAPAGAHTATVTVTDPVTRCTDTITTAAVDVFPPLEATAVVAPACSAFTYDVNVTGGSNAAGVAYAWTFSGSGTVDPASSTTRSGSVATGTAGVPYTASVVVTDRRTDIACTVTASGSARPHQTTAAARLTPTCGLSFGYEGTAIDALGAPLQGATCAWRFSNGVTATDCVGNTAAAAGAHTATVTITDPATGCTDTRVTLPVDVHPPLRVTADLTATCSSTFTYAAAVTGGSDATGTPVAWTFTGGGTASPAASSSRTGTVAVGTPAVAYNGRVVATDPRTDIACTAAASDAATPYAPITVRLSPAAAPPTCPSMSSDAVTYRATVSGGDGGYAFAWAGASCSGDACTVAAPPGAYCHTQTIHVTVGDGSGICPAAVSESETYRKVTVIDASDN